MSSLEGSVASTATLYAVVPIALPAVLDVVALDPAHSEELPS